VSLEDVMGRIVWGDQRFVDRIYDLIRSDPGVKGALLAALQPTIAALVKAAVADALKAKS
jgi:hypothetical protein